MVAALTAPATVTAGSINTYTAPTKTVLAASTTYWLRVDATSSGRTLLVDVNDETGAAGWSIADDGKQLFSGTWTADSSFKIKFAINGQAFVAPSAPTGVTATAGNGQVTLSWSDPSNSQISKYQYRPGIGSPPAWLGWTDILNSDADTVSHTVTGLTNGNLHSFEIRAVAGSLNGAASATVTATPQSPPTVSIAVQGNTTVTEGAAVVFRVTASRAVSANLTVNLLVVDAPNADFVSSTNQGNQTVTIASGSSTSDFTLSTEDDTTDEPRGGVAVALAASTGYTVGSPGTATVTVEDNDPTRVTLSVPDATATEGSSSDRATVRLALNRALRNEESLAIPLGFSGGVLDTDFSLSLSGSPTGVALSGGTVTFSSSSGVVSATSADILLSASADVDAVDETVTVSIPSASSGTPPILTATFLEGGATGSRTGNGQIVLSDVTPVVSFAAASGAVAESGGTRNVALSISPAPTTGITVNYTVSGSAGSSDFSITGSGTVTVAANATSVNIPVVVTDDNADEVAETVILTLNSGTGYAVGSTNVHTLTITDNDTPALVFSVTSLTVAEGSSGSYTVRLATLPTGTVTVTVGGASGEVTVDTNSGSPGNQNTLTFTTTTWNTAQTVTVAAGEDVDTTNDSATLSHSASGGGYGSITGNVAVTVTDNDTANTAPTVANVIADQSATAGTAFSYQFPANTFADADSDTLSYTATRGNDSALPTWLTFTGNSRTFSGTPQSTDVGTLSVKVTANDGNGGTVSDTFNIVVSAAPVNPVTPPVQSLPRVSISGGNAVVEGDPASFTVSVAPPPAAGETVTVNVQVSESGSVVESGRRTVVVNDSGAATFTVPTEDDATDEPDGAVTATVGSGAGYRVGSPAVATVGVRDNDPGLALSAASVQMLSGGQAGFALTLDTAPTAPVTVTVAVPDDTDLMVDTDPQRAGNQNMLVFTPANWSTEQRVRVLAGQAAGIVTVAISARGGDYEGLTAAIRVVVLAGSQVDASATAGWQVRFGRTVAQQVVTAVQGRFTTTPPAGLNITVAGEELTATPLEENEGALAKLLGFETVSSQQVAQGSSFAFSPPPAGEGEGEGMEAGGGPRLAVWGQGALASFHGQEDPLSLEGSVSTALVGADWRTQRWQAGAALARSWGNGSYGGGGDQQGDAALSGALTGLFPYGRYALTPRLGVWAVAGYGWGSLSVKPDGIEREDQPAATMAMGAVGMDGLLLDGGNAGLSIATTVDLLAVNTTTAEVEGLAAAEGNVSQLRVGLEATRPVPLANGAALLPSLEVGMRQDDGDAETGFGLEVGAALAWNDPQRGITAEAQGRSLVTHVEEEFRQQGLALSLSWNPNPTNRGPSLAIGHTMGATTASGVQVLVDPTVLEGLDASASNGQQFKAEVAYGFPAANDRLTLTPGVAVALSPDSRSYGILWSLAPYSQQGQTQPWEIALEGEWQQHSSPTPSVDHSLRLSFSLLF